MDNVSLGIYVPSCGRAETTKTFEWLENCTYVVRRSEEQKYRARGIEKLWVVNDNEIDNLVKTMNYIVDNAPEDIIFTIDDDVDYFIYRLEKNEKIEDKEAIMGEIERIAQLMYDLDIGFAAEDAAVAPWNYISEFTFKGSTGAFRWFNKKKYKARWNEDVYHNCDIDVMLQELMVNRIILRPMYFCVVAGTDTNAGGNSQKTRKEQVDCALKMKEKWGKYFDYNFENNKPKVSVDR